MKNVLVTGAAGFIGSNYVEYAKTQGVNLIFVDFLTYAADKEFSMNLDGEPNFIKADIRFIGPHFLDMYEIDTVINFAGESSVTESLKSVTPFIDTNIEGVDNLCNKVLKRGARLVHISTDEVYGETWTPVPESYRLHPSNPYAVTKASGDLLIQSYMRAFGLKATIVRPCNNYGPRQHPEKLIAGTIQKATLAEPITLFGNGKQVREWIYVEDAVRAIHRIAALDMNGIFNLGSGYRATTEYVVSKIKQLCKSDSEIKNTEGRAGDDQCYMIDSSLLRSMIGEYATTKFSDGIEKTIEWHQKHYFEG